MKRITLSMTILILVVATFAWAADMTGRQVLEKALKRYRGDDSVINILLTKARMDNPTDKKRFEITTWTLARPEINKALVAVRRAKNKESKPILFLVWDWQDPKKKDQLWYCLPSLGKYNEISAESGEKMTEQYGFSIEEMKTRDLDAAEHTNEGLVDYKGEKCYKVISVPKKPKAEGFSKVTAFVRPESWTAAYVEYTGLDGKVRRTLRVSEIKKVDGVWAEMKGHQEDFQKKYIVDFEVREVKFNQRLNASLFAFNEPPKEILEGK